MKTTARLGYVGGVAAAALAATALFAGTASASPSQSNNSSQHRSSDRDAAVFVQTDNLGGNTVVAYDRSDSGSLRQAGVYPTGGLGGALDGSVVDHLASQGSLAYDRPHGLLYAVNAGSNTLTVFSVNGHHLSRRQLISSGGSFPVSLAVKGNLVYVLNARAGGSVQGYVRVGDSLLRIPSWHRALGLDPSATPEFTNTPGQVAFTPDGSKLIVTTKANGSSIDVFGVDRFGGLSTKPVVNTESGTVPFGITFDGRGHLLVAEAGPNAVASFAIGRTGTLTPIAQAATGQAATCWIIGAGSSFFASNAGSANVSGYRDAGSGSLTALGNTRTDAGTVDAAVTSNGRFLYVQTGANGVVDGYRVSGDGSLTPIGSVTVPGAVGGEGIVTS